MKKDETELIRKIYETQKQNPTPGDFSELVRNDITEIGLNMSDLQISQLSKQKFKSIVKNKIKDAALNYLNGVKRGHSKMQSLSYETLQLQEYLNSPLFNNESRNLLLRLRTRTVNGIRCDFKGIYPDTSCPVGCGQSDTLQHILTCVVLGSMYRSTDISISDTKYEDIFSDNILKQKPITEMFRRLIQIRNNLISQPVVLQTGPVHSSITSTALQSNNSLLLVGS